MKFVIFKGFHFSISFPLVTIFSTKGSGFMERFGVVFTEGNKYDFGNETDQMRWNKLIGWKGLYFKPMFDSVMIAWRWNVEKDCFQLMPYFHLGSEAHTFDESNVVDVKMGVEAHATVSIENGVTAVVIASGGKHVKDMRKFSKNYSKYYRIAAWFGGTKPSPRTMSLKIDFS